MIEGAFIGGLILFVGLPLALVVVFVWTMAQAKRRQLEMRRRRALPMRHPEYLSALGGTFTRGRRK